MIKINLLKREKTICHSSLDGASKKQSSELFFVRKAIRYNESKWKTQDELMSELKSILPLKNKGSQRGFAQNPSCTFPYVLREGQIGRSTPACHPWTSVSEIPAFAGMAEQVGRSMVEMLGVLAVMGVLSVAGIAGYHNAMNRYRANTLIGEAQKRAVVVAGQIGFNGREPSLTEFEPYNKTSAGEFGNVTTEGLYKQFGIEVSGVTKPVCQNILNTLGEATPIRRLSLENTPGTPLSTCENTNDFLIIYNNDMQGATSDTEYAIDDSSCKSVCGVFNPETHLCDESDCEIPTNTCTVDTDCNTNNECMVCDMTSGQCKNGCERVQYLESTGTQYIDTGVVFNESVSYSWEIYGQVLTGNTDYTWLIGTQTPWTMGGTYPDFSQYTFYPVGTYYQNGQIVSNTSGEKYSPVKHVITQTGNSSNTLSLTLFARHNNNDGKSMGGTKRVFYCKIYDNDTPVRDLIPVTSPKGNCMFDRVSQKLFCNAGSGTFKTDKD